MENANDTNPNRLSTVHRDIKVDTRKNQSSIPTNDRRFNTLVSGH